MSPGVAGGARRRLLKAMALVPLLAPWAGRAAPVVHDVRAFGARGDGRSDDTGAFQRAIDALPRGGVLDVPAGHYLIDPLRSVRLRSHMHLRMAPAARLVAMPNGAERAYVLTLQRVEDVQLTGGGIVGERHAHRGGKGEWGHGIALRGASRVTIRDMRISDCWGDGISIGSASAGRGRPVIPSTDIELAGVACIGNRRQGLTIGRSRRVFVHDCEFSDTGGTPPAAGIDVEPDAGDVALDVRIERCVLRGNRGPGIQLWKRVAGVVIRDCLIEGNRNAGILAVGASRVEITGNRLVRNGQPGIVARRGATDIRVAGNRFLGNRRVRGAGLDGQVLVADDAARVRILAGNRVDPRR